MANKRKRPAKKSSNLVWAFYDRIVKMIEAHSQFWLLVIGAGSTSIIGSASTVIRELGVGGVILAGIFFFSIVVATAIGITKLTNVEGRKALSLATGFVVLGGIVVLLWPRNGEFLSRKDILGEGRRISELRFPIATKDDLKQEKIIARTVMVPMLHLAAKEVQVSSFGSTHQLFRKTFENCDFLGPGVLSLTGATVLSQINVRGSIGLEAHLLETKSMVLVGTIPVRDCQFVQCRFEEVAFAGTQSLLDKIRNSFVSE